MTKTATAPTTLEVDGRSIALRPLARADRDAVLAFANGLAAHDLLFLQRDIRNPKVVDAWLDQIEQGQISSLVAVEQDRVVGSNAMVRDELSWSGHVADIRILVGEDCRRIGLGRLLALHCLDRARRDRIEKLTVRITPDQTGALRLFAEMGFIPEALLRNQVRDARGETFDVAIMALDVERHLSQQRVYGLED
ncbi:MAG: GNAT family N-acetyltransferase [Sphingomonadales bacterium]|nr:GNAT family N-acetyltransferase [Sphingomonadales bacterium]MDE2568969.1 GNAT family N-acetyltransferase [Sphingomonadales bacterium]